MQVKHFLYQTLAFNQYITNFTYSYLEKNKKPNKLNLMGYELNIIRKNNWDDPAESSNITLQEWSDYAKQDPELERDVNERDGFYLWKGYPEDQSSGIPWFDYYKGFIASKNPNFVVIQKMISIAEALNAKIYDEEGEPFDYSFLGL